MGRIDVASAPELGKALTALPADGKDIVVDLSDVTFMDSTGLGVLIGAWTRCKNNNPATRVALVVATPEIARLLEVTGLTDVFEILPTLAEATAQ